MGAGTGGGGTVTNAAVKEGLVTRVRDVASSLSREELEAIAVNVVLTAADGSLLVSTTGWEFDDGWYRPARTWPFVHEEQYAVPHPPMWTALRGFESFLGPYYRGSRPLSHENIPNLIYGERTP